MTDYINPDILKNLRIDRPLPVSDGFVAVVNEHAADHSADAVAAAIAQSALVAIASLELKLYKLMEAVGAQEVNHSPGHFDVTIEEFGMNGGGIPVFDPEDRPWER